MHIREYIDNTQEKILEKISDLRIYIAALLVLVPSMNIQSEAVSSQKNKRIVNMYGQYHKSGESSEMMLSYEVIFKNGVRKTLHGLNSISQIPPGGQPIVYYWDTGKQMSPESIKAMNLPDRFDISPKVVNDPVSSIVLTIGNRKFDISPDFCNIKDIYLTPDVLVIETTLLFDVFYDKEEKLPELMYRLWNVPKGKGEKEGFKQTTVTEL